MSKPIYTIAQAKNLTKEEIMEFSEMMHLYEFTSEEAHLDLLAEIRARTLVFFRWNDAVYKKIANKHTWLKNKDKISSQKRSRKKHPDRDPDAFVSAYSQEKYVNHKVEVVKWHTTILKSCDGEVIEQVEAPKKEDLPDNFEGKTRVKESALFVSSYMPVKNMTSRQKNDTVAIMGQGFGGGITGVLDDFSHETAQVTHRILDEEKECSVMLVKYIPEVESGNTEMCYTVAAAVFVPVTTKRHTKKNGKVQKMQQKTIRTVNLVQIATLPEFAGRNLGGILLEHSIKQRLQVAGYDLLIICGCFEKFYRKLNFAQNPDWLRKSPFNLDVPDENDVRSQQAYNRDLFFYLPLSEKYHLNMAKSKDEFLFAFDAAVLNEYYGVVEEEEESVGEALTRLSIANEN